MVEFAIVLPIYLLLLLGIAQFGTVFNHTRAHGRSRAGARFGARSGSGTCARSTRNVAKVKASAANLDQSKIGVTVTSTWEAGADLKVCASYPYSINLIGLVVQQRKPELMHNGASRMTEAAIPDEGANAVRWGPARRLGRRTQRHRSVRHRRRLIIRAHRAKRGG